MRDINSFQGNYRWLSNFYPAPMIYKGVLWRTTEHAYQAAKSDDPNVHFDFMDITAGQAKKRGRELVMRDDWDDIKLYVMAELTTLKYQIPSLRQLLLETGTRHIIEGNSWGDTFFGVCNGIGENHLGKILMAERYRILQKEMSKGILVSGEEWK